MRTSTDPCDPRFFPVLTQHRPDVPGNRDGSSRRHPHAVVVEAEFGHGVELALQEPGHRLAVDDRLAGLLGHIEAARRAVVLEQADGVELLGPRMVDYAAFLQRSVDP